MNTMDWHAVRSGAEIIFTAGGSIDRADIPTICQNARGAIAQSEPETIVFDMAALVHADAVVVEALARLHLTLKRLGCTLQIRNLRPHMQELVEFMGLNDVLPPSEGTAS